MKISTGLYNTFLWSLLLATLLFNDTWLQMRVNIGYLFFVCWLLTFLFFILIKRRHQISQWFTVINTVVTIILAILIEGGTNLMVIPAAFIREGLHSENISFATINLILMTVIVGGFLISLGRLIKNSRK